MKKIEALKEQPVCEGLEEAVVDYFEGYWPGMETAEQCNTDLHFTPPAIMRLARHFAQWGAEHAKIDVTDFCKPIDPGIAQCIAEHFWEMLGEDEKPVPKDLEEAAENYEQTRNDLDAISDNEIVRRAFIAGAKWDRNQMMKGGGGR